MARPRKIPEGTKTLVNDDGTPRGGCTVGVIMAQSMAGVHSSYDVGDLVLVTADVADAWQEAGIANKVAIAAEE